MTASANRAPRRSLGDRFLFQEYAPLTRGLPAVRIVYALLLLVFWTPNAEWVTRVPDTFLAPAPGPFLLLRHIPSETTVGLLELVRVASAGALLVGWRTPAASVMTTLSAFAVMGLQYSFGKIDHSILIVIVPLMLAPSGWGHRWSVDAWAGRNPRPRPWSPALLALAIGSAYAAAGMDKALGGWLDPSTQAAQRYVLRRAFGDGDALLSGVVRTLDVPWLWEAVDLATIGIEVGVLLLAARLGWFRLGLAGLVGLHLSIFLTMGIDFGPTTYVYMVFLPWDRLVDRAAAVLDTLSPVARIRLKHAALAASTVAIAVSAAAAITNKPPFLTFVRTVIPSAAGIAPYWQLAAATLVTAVAVGRIVAARLGRLPRRHEAHEDAVVVSSAGPG